MRSIEIDLAEPLDTILATVLSLPAGCSDVVRDPFTHEAEMKHLVRALHEAANSRHVEPKVNRVAITPPIFDSLKAKPFHVGTQTDLLIEAAARLIKRTGDCRRPRRDD